LVQAALHDVCPLAQHTPEEQEPPDAHVFPHAPQLLTLVVKLTQVPLQFVWPAGQQTPLAQLAPEPQTVEHVPQ
jgi:hypothetical protein